ncbi:hypothetical protein [Citrobacter rodentium]|uniref:Lateral flagellar associated protein n=2 Tax=Citrobacter rodentium TaxID=67825 RepID=D2TJ77_CITRI|nr:hypothetical protein [Citrobacter rodentium]KIQ51738.1 lysine-N-methylase [Citrobacter rodentium]QBY31539.1 lysine-N-methylase [Citrobacter rodentium]UHO31105.1 lysine-N-methylase [Citrobacter rodentium NBRC 105723 = DSM 16636]CBG87084.1 lateral flagellar associated protein [Citrobacter rodentium ICC168]HAT8014118.1 lysine-N-methylase [Citrobacter rodentium NBRC 105723 = DSM 16636]
MKMIECYEPDFVRTFLSRHPGSPLHTRQVWQDEIRHSLTLTDAASCEAAFGNPHAFALHTSQCEAMPDGQPLSLREQTLNQAALNAVTLPALQPELRLYALGILLSYSEKLPGNSEETLAQIASLPTSLANLARSGKLQQQFALLPSVPQLQCRLITLLGGQEFDWQTLPDGARKISLPLQVSLLALQDANSEALLQQQLQAQWQETHERYFAHEAWIFSNYLIYRLYHDMFPQHDGEGVAGRYFALACDFFLIRTLFSLWTLDGSSLSHADIFALFALFERWRHSESAAFLRRQAESRLPTDHLLSAFSLLIC